MTEPTMYTDHPTIASDPIYVGPPTDLTLEEGVGEVRVWSDEDGSWIDAHWRRDGDELRFLEALKGVSITVRVVEVHPVDERERPDIGDYGQEVE